MNWNMHTAVAAIVFTAAFAVLHAAAGFAAGEFVSTWTTTQTDNTSHVAWGDYDGDGDLDFAAGNYSQATRVYRNDGAGSFTLVWSSAATAPTQSVEWGDSDGDGDLDLLLGNWNNQTRVYRNDGAGVFTLIWNSAQLDKTYQAAWGDFDNDGDPDIATAAEGQNRVYRNDGSNQFTLVWSSTETDNSRAAAWADFDRDGDLDLLSGNYGTTRVYRNDGQEDFSLAWSAPQVDTTLGAAWGDYDADGYPDIALANTGSKANRVYRNSGAGSFSLAWTSTETDSSQSAEWGDFDADGDMDLLIGNFFSQPDRVYRNSGGSLSLYWTSTETAETYDAQFGDYDGDGDLDILTAGYAQANRVYQNTVSAANTAPSAPALTNKLDDEPGWITLQWTAPSDDHTPSALLGYQLRIGTTPGGSEIMSGAVTAYPGNAGNATSRTVYLPLGTYYWSVAAIDTSFKVSSFAAEDSFTLTAQPFQSAATSAETDDTASVAYADYDGDGDHDILTGNIGQPNRVYRNNGGSLVLAWSSAESDNTRSVAWADYDGDGDLDFAAGNDGQPNRVYQNTGGSWSAVWSSVETDSTYAVAWADYDRDGDMDLFVGNSAQANRVYRNDGAGAFTLIWSSTETDDTRAIAPADYDRDGDPDILAGNYGQANRVYRNDGAGAFILVWSSGETDNTTSVAWGYPDPDNDIDIAVGNYGQSNRVYRNDGGGSFALVKTFAATDATTGVQWGDADGDGDADLLFVNDSEPAALYEGDGVNGFTLLWNSPESDAVRSAALFDYDGDGDVDYYAAANGANRVYRNKMNPNNSAPPAPVITAEPDGDPGSFILQWTASSDDHTSLFHTAYQLRIGTLSGRNDVVSGAIVSYPGNAEATVSFHITLDTGVYFWSLRAIDGTGFTASPWSAEDMFLVSGPDTNAPLFDGVQSAAGCGSGCVSLSWIAAGDLQNSTPVTYRVFAATAAGAQNFSSPVTTTTSTSADVTGLSDDTTYYFVVRAMDTAGNEDTNTVEVSAAPSSLPSFTKHADNPVLAGDGTGFDAVGVMDPQVYYDGNIFHMWYTGRGAAGTDKIGYAVSKDGVNWARVQGSESGGVLQVNPDANAFDAIGISSGFIMPDPPTSSYKYYMWYGGVRGDNPNSWRIGLARSNDGIIWERVPGTDQGGSVIGWTSDTFDEYSAYGPWVIYEDGQYKMWYTGAEVNTMTFTYEYRIGYATSIDGLNWTKYSGPEASGSLITMGAAGSFDEKRATHPTIYKENNLYKMIYSGFDGSKYRMGYAASPDGIAWTKYPGPLTKGSIIDNGTSYDTTIAGLNSLRAFNNALHLWYKAYTGTASEYYIMYANNGGVSPPQLTSIAIAASGATLLEPGDTLAFSATCNYSGLNPYCGGLDSCDCTDTVAWSSGNTAAATIGQLTGLATAVAMGDADITASCAGVTSSAITINVATYPTVAIISPLDGAQISGSTTVTGTVQDPALSSWFLYYSPRARPDRLTLIASGASQVASGTLATWNTANMRGYYTLHLAAQNTGGYFSTDTVDVFVLNKGTISGTIPAFEWVLLSVPVIPDSPAPTAMFASTHQEYKVYRWDPEAASQNYLLQYVYPDTLSTGQGFWIKSYYNTLPYSYTGDLADTTESYSISLTTGWNQFGVPYNRAYDWSDVLVSYQGTEYALAAAVDMGLIGGTVYSYDNIIGSWTMNDTSAQLTPGTGYDVRAYADVSLVFDPDAVAGDMLLARRVRNAFDYRVKISARSANSADTDNYFGAADSAAEEFDALDAEEPPRSPNEKYTVLYFPREQWSSRAGRYAADVRAPARAQGNTQSWEFVVETTDAGETVTLTWDAAALPSARYSFTLEDTQTGARIDMTVQNSYTYTASAGSVSQSRFRIEVVALTVQTVTRTHTLEPGWRLISVPLDPEVTGALDQLGDDLPLLQVFQYHDRVFYAGADADIQAGLGYWVHVDASTQIDITGPALPQDRSVRVPVHIGWNMIGNPFDAPLAWGANISLECADTALSLEQAVQTGITDGALYEYTGADYARLPDGGSLAPWTGYLLRMRAACDLVLKR